MENSKKQYIVVVKSVRELVYQSLRNEIVTMELKPGTVISTQDIASKLDVSRTPVREAFIRLQGECLLEISPQKATVVSRIDYRRVRQERFIREALEVQNMKGFVAKATRETIQAMRENIAEQYQALQKNDFMKYLELDNGFHQLEFVDTHEELAASLIVQMNGHYDRARLIETSESDITDRICREHENLVDLIEKRDQDGAVEALQRHIREVDFHQGRLTQKWPDYFVKE